MIVVSNKKLDARLDMLWHTMQTAIQLREDNHGKKAMSQVQLDEATVERLQNMVNAYYRAVAVNDPRDRPEPEKPKTSPLEKYVYTIAAARAQFRRGATYVRVCVPGGRIFTVYSDRAKSDLKLLRRDHQCP